MAFVAFACLLVDLLDLGDPRLARIITWLGIRPSLSDALRFFFCGLVDGLFPDF